MGRRRRGGKRDLGTWFFIIVFPLIFVCGGTAALLFGADHTRDSIRSRHWPRAAGRIVYAAVRSPQSVDVRVVYDYPVGGRYYRAYRHDFAFSHARRSHGYQAGDAVSVYYDPADPRSAVLAPGFRLGPLLFALFGAVCIVVGILIGRFVYKEDATPS